MDTTERTVESDYDDPYTVREHTGCTPSEVRRIVRDATGRTVQWRTEGLPAFGSIRISKRALTEAMRDADGFDSGPTFTVDVWPHTVYVRAEQRYIPKQ